MRISAVWMHSLSPTKYADFLESVRPLKIQYTKLQILNTELRSAKFPYMQL